MPKRVRVQVLHLIKVKNDQGNQIIIRVSTISKTDKSLRHLKTIIVFLMTICHLFNIQIPRYIEAKTRLRPLVFNLM